MKRPPGLRKLYTYYNYQLAQRCRCLQPSISFINFKSVTVSFEGVCSDPAVCCRESLSEKTSTGLPEASHLRLSQVILVRSTGNRQSGYFLTLTKVSKLKPLKLVRDWDIHGNNRQSVDDGTSSNAKSFALQNPTLAKRHASPYQKSCAGCVSPAEL